MLSIHRLILDFDYLGIQTLYDRYLVVDKTEHETQAFGNSTVILDASGDGSFAHEDNPEDQIISLYNLYKSRRFCSSTPTLI